MLCRVWERTKEKKWNAHQRYMKTEKERKAILSIFNSLCNQMFISQITALKCEDKEQSWNRHRHVHHYNQISDESVLSFQWQIPKILHLNLGNMVSTFAETAPLKEQFRMKIMKIMSFSCYFKQKWLSFFNEIQLLSMSGRRKKNKNLNVVHTTCVLYFKSSEVIH